MKQPDEITKVLIAKTAGPGGPSLEDLMRLQRKWATIAKQAKHPFAFCGQKYV